MKTLNVVVVSILVFCSSVAFADNSEKVVGSHIAKKNFEVPVSEKKSYSELSDKEKEIVRSSYKDLLEIDVPPYPKKGIVSIVKPVRKAYEKVAREGRVVSVAVVDEKGNAKKVSIFETIHPAISKVVAAALMKTKYTPGTCNGEACTSEYLFTIVLGSKRSSSPIDTRRKR